jgi:hypothetical protein
MGHSEAELMHRHSGYLTEMKVMQAPEHPASES